jgi:hypothetical protein
MSIGPLDYMVIGFEGNRFTGAIRAEVDTLRKDGIIRVLDAVLVIKDPGGAVQVIEASDLAEDEAEAIGLVDEGARPWLGADDVERVAGRLAPDSSVAIVVLEHLWARRLRDAIRDAGGQLLEQQRVPADLVDEISARLAAQTSDERPPSAGLVSGP